MKTIRCYVLRKRNTTEELYQKIGYTNNLTGKKEDADRYEIF